MTFRNSAPNQREHLTPTTYALVASTFHGVAAALFHPLIIIAFFISRVSDESRDVALVAVISTATWYVPQLLTNWGSRYYPQVYPVVVAASVVRLASVSLMAAFVLRTDSPDAVLARQFLLILVAYQLASAALVPAMNELMARAVPARHLTTLFRNRFIVGSVAAMVAGLVAARGLGVDAPPFPRGFGLLFLVAAMATGAESWFLLRLREVKSEDLPRERVGSIAPSRLVAALAGGGFRKFALFRIIIALAAIADPYLIVHGMREIEPSSRFLGLYIVTFAAANLAGTAAANDLTVLGAARSVFQVAALLRFATPILALLIPLLYTSEAASSGVAAALFGSVFVGLGLITAAHGGTTQHTLLALHPPGARAAGITLLNVALCFCALAPLLGSRLVEQRGTAALLGVASAIGFIAVVFSGALIAPSPRRSRRRRPGKRRLRAVPKKRKPRRR
ncbi:MAG: hypothetical protein H0W06_02615 [Chloroflexia bacterium]|nr:hypothetical protein [Chloroflexia bacterium]